ncbi:MAG: multicopper oxidase domain-containing protein [Pseudomonadota bacterium]
MSFKLSRRGFVTGGSAFLGSGYLNMAWAKTGSTVLPIPKLLDGTNGEPLDLKIRQGEWSFLPGIKTPTLGISQDYLAPTIRTRRNSELYLHYENTLSQGAAIHGHGLHVPGEVDGGPQLEIPPGELWQPKLSIVQPAATCWYHSHTHGISGEQVYRGLAGMIIIDDDESDLLELPRSYGVDDLPVIIQDRTFDDQGRFVYSLQDAGEDGWYGETVIINGAVSPMANVPAGKVRLRLLNGANARFYIVAFADGRPFHKIACDGGLLEAPVEMTEMEMSPGERCEIIVDMADGATAELLTLFEDELEEGVLENLLTSVFESANSKPQPSLTLKVDGSLPAETAPLPGKLAAIDRPDPAKIQRTRDFVLDMSETDDGDDHNHDHGGTHQNTGHMNMNMTINGAVMDMNVVNERVERGVWERWRVTSNQGEHPFHVHGCSFLIDKLGGAEPPTDQMGWKDTVVLDDEGWSEFVVRFDHLADEKHPYMYHCHILEHEDHGMMGQFTVT